MPRVAIAATEAHAQRAVCFLLFWAELRHSFVGIIGKLIACKMHPKPDKNSAIKEVFLPLFIAQRDRRRPSACGGRVF
jgi:hypothetical protein